MDATLLFVACKCVINMLSDSRHHCLNSQQRTRGRIRIIHWLVYVCVCMFTIIYNINNFNSQGSSLFQCTDIILDSIYCGELCWPLSSGEDNVF